MNVKQLRKIVICTAFLLAIILINLLSFMEQERLLARGPMNSGHDELECEACHAKTIGTLRQQLQAKVKYQLGFRETNIDFGSQDVSNTQCLNCHERPNDRHPVFRFTEPKFVETRQQIAVHKCESCHKEHQGKRVTIAPTYCQHCHSDLDLKDDPIDVSHKTLIAQNQWATCLQCHDFHGNHLMKTARKLKDTIPCSAIQQYFEGMASPYSATKKYKAIDQE